MIEGRAVRRLGSFERAQAITGGRFPYNLVAYIALDGSLPPERLRTALDRIQRRTPLLRARLEGTNRGAVFRLADMPPLPLRQVPSGDWRRRVEGELDTGFDLERGPLARCLYAPACEESPEAGCELVLTFHHAIADGVGVGSLVHELLSLGATGRLVAESVEDALPPSADERFPARYRRAGTRPVGLRFLARQVADEISFRWRRRKRAAVPAPGPSRCRVLTTDLSADETTALVWASHRRRVSLTAALEAAMLLAVSRRRYGGERLPLRYFTFPMLRPYLEPPIDEGVFGSYLTTMRFTIEIGGEDELWPVAAAIGRQIHTAARCGEKYLASIWSPLSMKMVLRQRSQRMSTTALSYTGPIGLELDPPPAAGRLRVRDIHAFVSNFPVGPEYTAQARIQRGRLTWDIVYLDVDMTREEAVAIAREMKHLLIGPRPVSGSRQ